MNKILKNAAGEKTDLALDAPATTDLNLDFFEEIKKRYPRHNVDEEFKGCSRYWSDRGKPVTEGRFERWMKRAERVLKAPRRVKRSDIPEACCELSPEQADPAQVARFMEEYETRKARKLAKKTHEPGGAV